MRLAKAGRADEVFRGPVEQPDEFLLQQEGTGVVVTYPFIFNSVGY